MLNLVVQRQDVVELGRGGVTGICVDSGHVYVVYGNAEIQCLEDRGSKVKWEAFLPEGCGDPIDLRYLIDLDALCICMSDGRMLLFGGEDGLIEEVGEVEGGIAGAEWSPDEELLVLLTRGAKIIVMTKDWSVLQEMDVVSELGLSTEETEQMNTYQIDVTWRGDAQFFASSICSSGGRYLIVWDRSSLALHAQVECESQVTCVAWQPNGRHLYASTSDDGVVLYEKNGLEHGKFGIRSSGKIITMKWSPDSQLLGIVTEGSSMSENKRVLQVWRRSNWHWYLKYESWWPTSDGDLHICWDEENLKLHVMTSAGMYNTYEFGLDACVSARGTAAVVDGNQLKLSSFRNTVIPPPMASVGIQFPAAIRTVSFLDGEDVEGVAVWLASGNIGVALCADGDHWEDLETDLEDDEVDDTDHYGVLSSLTGRIISGVDLADLGSPVHSIIWASKMELIAAVSLAGKEAHRILRFQLEEQEQSWNGKQVEQGSETSGAILQCAVVSGQIITALHTGSVIHHSQDESVHLSNFPEPCQRLFTSPSMPAIPGTDIPGFVGLSRNGCLYFGGSLLSTGVTSVGIRSEGPGGPFILYTTKANQLHVVKLSQLGSLNQQAPTDAKEIHSRPGIAVGKQIVRSGPTRNMHAAMRPAASITGQQNLDVRQVEQGGRIVSIPPGGTKVVLQMPRGNLETIHPRILVLCAIADHLNKEMYDEAWELSTVNRVDLNIIVDYNWPEFLQQTKAFVASVEREEDICDLVMALKPESVLDDDNGLYRTAPLPSPLRTPDAALEDLEAGKISSICKSLRSALLHTGTTEYLQAIVITFARSDPPDLDSALKCIKSAREAELEALNSQSTGKAVASEQASKALKHLMLYVNTSTLYEVALGLYDLELAYMVVTNAQMDPAEYLLELQTFASYHPPNFQKYHIDMHLKRFPKALENLVKSGDEHFDGCLNLAKQKGLLHELLAIVDEHESGEDCNKRLRVLQTSGEWLLDQNMHDDAAVAFLAAGETMKAFEAYKKGCCWEMCLSLAGKLQMNEDQIRDCAMDLLEELKSDRRLQDAATIAVEYLEDIDEAVMLLSDARYWRKALRIAYRHDREDLVETVVAPTAAECASTSLTTFKDDAERLDKYWNRLKEVRAKRHAMEAVIGDTGNTAVPEQDAVDELIQGEDGASTVAGMSVYTDRTNAIATTTTASMSALTTGGKKPQKKKKRKKKGMRIRQGSPEEERALCEHIKNLKPTDQVCEEIGQLMELLILLGHEKDARILQHALDTVIKRQQEANNDIQKNPPPDPSSAGHTSIQSGPRWKLDILRGAIHSK